MPGKESRTQRFRRDCCGTLLWQSVRLQCIHALAILLAANPAQSATTPPSPPPQRHRSRTDMGHALRLGQGSASPASHTLPGPIDFSERADCPATHKPHTIDSLHIHRVLSWKAPVCQHHVRSNHAHPPTITTATNTKTKRTMLKLAVCSLRVGTTSGRSEVRTTRRMREIRVKPQAWWLRTARRRNSKRKCSCLCPRK